MNQVRRAVISWLNQQGIRNPEELDYEDYQKVKTLLGTDRPAFGIFFSMMMFERQQAVMQLMTCDLSNSAGAVRAAKLQGIIQCIDNVRDLIMNIADPTGESSIAGPREIAGVRFNDGSSEHEPVSTASEWPIGR